MKTTIGIPDEDRAALAVQLSKSLADEFVLYAKTRNAHWNVERPHLREMHVFFESQYNALDDLMDRVAGRIRTTGHYPPATLKSFSELTHLAEVTRDKNDSNGFIEELVEDHQTIIEFVRGNINPIGEKHNDVGTSDFITSLMEEHEKMAWMLRSHLKQWAA